MSNTLRPPSLGPIVGHTTGDSVRLWMRGAGEPGQRTIGVAAQVVNGRATKKSARYFRLHREFDRTGVVEFTGLVPATRHEFRLGSLAIDSVDPDVIVDDDELVARLPKPEQWVADLDSLPEAESLAEVATFPAGTAAPLSFAFGSCRYPGILWQRKRADAIFRAIGDKFLEDRSLQFLLMVGDQIYADMFNRAVPVGLADTEEEFRERYETAFGSPNMRELLRRTTTYMILDDHEIEDNWVQGRVKRREKRILFNMAIGAYRSYQWSHGPRTFGKKLYYSFDCGANPFFVIDGRTQRIREDKDVILEDNHMLGNPRQAFHDDEYSGQIDDLCAWLVDSQARRGDAPKFVVSPSVFVPNDVATVPNQKRWKSDSWPAFPQTRAQLLRTILDSKVQNVVFLSGDIHCSNVAEIDFESGGVALPIKAFSVTSSAFYWPFPFADGDPLGFVHDSRRQGDAFSFETSQGKATMNYRARAFEQEDNFTRVDFDGGKKLLVINYDKTGKELHRSELKLA